MKRYIPVLFAASTFLSAACGGGSPPAVTPTSVPAATPTPGTSSASGVVVNDANGSALAGVPVKLMPWAPCAATPSPATSITPGNDGCPTPLPSPQVTTDPSGAFTLRGVPNGRYLLVIGNDVAYTPPPGYAPPACTNTCGTPTPAPFTVQAVVHDSVTLTGGNQTLEAPALPAIPTITPPPWETDGEYRLATLDASTEMPCYIAWQYERAQNGLAGSSVDEWLTENVRAVNQARQMKTGAYITVTNFGAADQGGTSCNQSLVDPAIFATNPTANVAAVDPRSVWFSGQWTLYQASGTNFYQGIGLTEFPIDPRSISDPSQPVWP